jgi:hypothetical protein
MKIAEYEILVQELHPPIGGVNNHFAVIQFISIETPNGNKRISPDFGETYGKTEEEARSKMQAKLDNWLTENS